MSIIILDGKERVTRHERVSVGRYRFYHNLGHDKFFPNVVFRRRSTVSYCVPWVTDKFFDIEFFDSRNGNPIEYTSPYYMGMVGKN